MRLWGPLSGMGLLVIILVLSLDQATKALILYGLDMRQGQTIPVTSFFDLTLVWNRGVSYGMFQSNTQYFLIAVSLVISVVLWSWLCRSHSRVTAFAIGLVTGGALGNALDRGIYGGVTDFLHFFWNGWHWYIFNVADMAIVVGVGLLLYESIIETQRTKGA